MPHFPSIIKSTQNVILAALACRIPQHVTITIGRRLHRIAWINIFFYVKKNTICFSLYEKDFIRGTRFNPKLLIFFILQFHVMSSRSPCGQRKPENLV